MEERVLFGFWHNKLGAEKKLVAWGWGSGQISEALHAFHKVFPKKSYENLTLTLDRSEEEYRKIAQSQADGEVEPYPEFKRVEREVESSFRLVSPERVKTIESVNQYLNRLSVETAELKKRSSIPVEVKAERQPKFYRILDQTKPWSEQNAVPVW